MSKTPKKDEKAKTPVKDDKVKTPPKDIKDSKSNNNASPVKTNPSVVPKNQRTNSEMLGTGEPRVVTSVLVENFPSRQELFDEIDKYLDSSSLNKQYRAYNKGSSLEIFFENPDISFGFIKYLNNIKLKNSLYNKCKANLVMETKKPLQKFDPKKLYHYDTKKYEKILKKEVTDLDKSIDEIPDPKRENDIHKRVELKAKKKKLKLMKDYLVNEHFFLNNASPYKVDEELNKVVVAKEKAKIISEKEFLSYGQHRHSYDKVNKGNDYIANEYSPRKDLFRQQDKHKWIGKNFNSMVLDHKNLYKIS